MQRWHPREHPVEGGTQQASASCSCGWEFCNREKASIAWAVKLQGRTCEARMRSPACGANIAGFSYRHPIQGKDGDAGEVLRSFLIETEGFTTWES